MSSYLKHMKAQKDKDDIMFMPGKKLAFNIFFVIKLCKSLHLGFCDIGPAYLKAPIKTSQQYSYIRHVLRKIN